MDKVSVRKKFRCRSISSVMDLSLQIVRSLLELHLDQWNAKHVTLIGFDNHAFLFLSDFQTLRSMMNISPRYIPLNKSLVNVLVPLLSLTRDVLSLYRAAKAIEKSLSARDAGGVTYGVNGNVIVRLVVPMHALLDRLQGNENSK